MEELDVVKQYQKRVGKPLAELRAKQLLDIERCKASIETDGVAIGISPTDAILNKYDRVEITNVIIKIFKRIRARDRDGALRPITPLAVHLVGEYSDKHRWHYHGIIKVDNILILDKIKKRIHQVIGRCVTEQIRNEEQYIDYMFKQYECQAHGDYYCWDPKECYIHIHK